MPTESHSSGSVLGLGLIFGFIGVVVLLAGGVVALFSIDFVSSTTATTGTVIANNAEESCSRSKDHGTTCSTVYEPVVEFTAPSGEKIKFTSEGGSSPPRYGIGDTVTVRYRPNDPHDAEIDDFSSLWLAPTIVAGIGLAFLAIGIGLLIGHFRRPRHHVAPEVTDVPTWGLKP